LLLIVMDFYGVLWSFRDCIDCFRCPWRSVEFHGLLWTVLDFSGFLWSFMECYGVLGILVVFHGMQRMTMDGGAHG
jgi:hypothetical protein